MSGMMTSWLTIGFGGSARDDAGLGDPQIAAVRDALLGMPDGRALHRTLHGARSAAGADVKSAQTHLVADVLGVLVLLAARSNGRPSTRSRFGGAFTSSRRALRRIWNTALVTPLESVRSKRPLAMISFEMYTMSRSTANRCSLMPMIISPSTKADSGGVAHLQLDAPGMAHDLDLESPDDARRSLWRCRCRRRC